MFIVSFANELAQREPLFLAVDADATAAAAAAAFVLCEFRLCFAGISIRIHTVDSI